MPLRHWATHTRSHLFTLKAIEAANPSAGMFLGVGRKVTWTQGGHIWNSTHSKLSSGLNWRPWSCETAMLSAVPLCHCFLIIMLIFQIISSHLKTWYHIPPTLYTPWDTFMNELFPFHLTGAESAQPPRGGLELTSIQLQSDQRDSQSLSLSNAEGDSDSFSDVF